MAKYNEVFDSQIQKFRDLKEKRDEAVKKLESSERTYKELMQKKKQIFNLFSVDAAELRSNPSYVKAQKLRTEYLKAKRIYESEEKKETNSDFYRICENLKSYALLMQEEGNGLIHKMLIEWASTSQINERFYHKWQDILTYFKNFCAWRSNNICEEEEKDNSIIIDQLWLKETFNIIYNKCVVFADKYESPKIRWVEYFNIMVNMFKNIEDTIEHSKDEWFSVEKEDNLFY